MIDPLKTDITFYPLQFSRNRMEWQMAPAISTLTSRTGLKYFLGIRVPDFPGSATFTTLTTLEGREQPPIVLGSSVTYPGAFFRIDEILDNYLEREKPNFSQVGMSILARLTMPYQLYEQVQGGTPAVNTNKYTQTRWLFKGGIADEDSSWYEQFFHVFLRDTRQFLTWQPTQKIVDRQQEEYLYFLFNFTPPSQVKCRIEIIYRDGTQIERDAGTISNIPLYSVLCCPVGPKALSLDNDSNIASYRVWLSNQDNLRISEVRTYYIDNRYRPQQRWLLFNNSLSGWDTLRLLGRSEQTVVVERSQAQIQTWGETGIESAELRIVEIKGDTQLTISTGWFERDADIMATYLTELLYAESIYLITEKGHIPVILSDTQLITHQDDTDLVSRSLTFERTKAERNYSRLPYLLDNSQARATSWIGVDIQPVLDSFGKRTGYEQPVRLRKIYSDTGGDYIPLTEKPNVSSDPNYIAPTIMPGVTPGTTPYSSAAITREGTYSKMDCATNQIGEPALIVIPAGKYGSEISQTDANNKAENEYNALNTQAYANQNGTCTLMPYFNVLYTRQSTFIRNNCSAGQIGNYAQITIPAGMYGSAISQADADAKAIAAANLLDTQAYANQYGACLVNPYTAIQKTVTVFTNNYHTINISATVLINNNGTYTITLNISCPTLQIYNVLWDKSPIYINGGGSLADTFSQTIAASNKGVVIPESTLSWWQTDNVGTYPSGTTMPSFTLL